MHKIQDLVQVYSKILQAFLLFFLEIRCTFCSFSNLGLGSESPRTHLSSCDDLDLTHLNVRRS